MKDPLFTVAASLALLAPDAHAASSLYWNFDGFFTSILIFGLVVFVVVKGIGSFSKTVQDNAAQRKRAEREKEEDEARARRGD